MKVEIVGDWKLADKIINSAPADVKKALSQAVRIEALHLEKAIKENIQKGPPPALSKLTLKKRKGAKGGTKPLNATGSLRSSVHVVMPPGSYSAFIGINRTSKQYNLATVHEEGRTIVLNVTPKMLRYLFGVLFKGEPPKPGSGTGIIVIHIPARPFIKPAFEAESPKAPQRFQDNLAKLLGTSWGA